MGVVVVCVGGRADNDVASSIQQQYGFGSVLDVRGMVWVYLHDGGTRAVAIVARRQEAKDMGLVDAVFGTPDSLRRAVEDMAIEIASRAPLGIRAAKQLLDGTQHMPLSDALESSKGPRIALNFTRDFKEGVTAFAEKRSPCFLGE